MSRIDELIAELCPDGVEFRALSDVLKIKNGKDHKLLGDGDIPVYGSGGIMRYVDTAAAQGPSVLIPRKGSLGNLFYVEGPFWVVDTIFRTEIDASVVEPKFLYHQLLTMGLGDMNQAGGVPSQTQSVLGKLRIPVPPLEVQREIVRILDQFTQLEAELEAELEARRRQYQHYRDSLLTFPEAGGVRRAPMGEIGTFIRGRRFTKDDVVDIGIPSIHYGEIYTHYGVAATTARSSVRRDISNQLRFAQPGDVVIAAVGETVDDVGKAVAWLGSEPVAIHDDTFLFRSGMNPTFVSYALQTADFHAQKNKHVARAKVKRLGGESLAKIEIPLPPRDVQDRIVERLDKFDALVNDLSIGLPAELAARRKQYEHYRDKLLTFEEAVA
ncbi:MAG TPA: restriction endonuclease subunit S [Microbacteriaceae bacterium]|nr:restriction endonuclease subunit S [Microbacteriaceae bacterium]